MGETGTTRLFTCSSLADSERSDCDVPEELCDVTVSEENCFRAKQAVGFEHNRAEGSVDFHFPWRT